MRYIGLVLLGAWGVIAGSCCSTANCSGSELTFSIGFITTERDYFYFSDTENVDLKAFYGDSVFVQVNKQEVGEADSTMITFFVYPNSQFDNYTILANDTLLGSMNLQYGTTESQCCGTDFDIIDHSFESDQDFHMEEGHLQIIL